MICEDMWYETVAAHLASQTAELLIVPNGSPFERTKLDQRVALAATRVRETGLPLAYVNQVGGQDELVFDGGSFVVNADGELAVRMPVWKEDVGLTQWCHRGGAWMCVQQEPAPLPSAHANTYQALMLGLRDYVNKNRFPGVLLGLSGGIDSALTAVVAVDALGADRVRGVRLPSRFTSEDSQSDAEVCARRLGIALDTVPIGDVVDAIERTLGRGEAPRHHRGEHPSAGTRPAPDGAVEQVRLDAVDDGKQIGNVGRLRDVVRRHVRRLLCAEGSVQD
jgi:NAD+ synthase